MRSWFPSPFLSLGYWKREDRSQGTFVGGFDDSGNRSFMTGDLVACCPMDR
ncbi:MAG: hypothetical protein IPJ33_15900 [Gammaproteobacteria bacterium]|nr:hypothetical protein [Gammaproteobacteria bacterium]